MTAFLNDFSKFYGTGEKNEAGQNLEEFLNCMIRENMKHQAIRQMQSYLHMKGKAVILLTD